MDPTVDELKKQNEELQNTIKTNASKIADYEKNNADLKKQLEETGTSKFFSKVTKEKMEANEKLIEDLKKENEELKKNKGGKKMTLRERFKARFKR